MCGDDAGDDDDDDGCVFIRGSLNLLTGQNVGVCTIHSILLFCARKSANRRAMVLYANLSANFSPARKHVLFLSDADEALHSFLAKAGHPEHFSDHKRKILVLARNWLQVYLPHCLQKINRVTFGLMNEDEYERFIALEPQMPESRSKLAIPFVGKDTPAPASEFAHPDIIIGLSIVAYRIEHLRLEDIHDIIKLLQVKFRQEVAYPKPKRPTYLMYRDWVNSVKGAKACDLRCRSNPASAEDKDVRSVPTLDILKISNDEEMALVFDVLKSHSEVIDYYLHTILFPKFMRFQKVKLQASAQEIGSQMMFHNRLGFSGTPSNVIPKLLGDCEFEPGSQARIIATMTNPDVVTHEFMDSNWNAQKILDKIADARDEDKVSPKYGLVSLCAATTAPLQCPLMDHNM